MNLRIEPGFLGTDASMLADLTLLAYILLLVPAMLVGFMFARRKMFEPYHKFVMTGITVFNWLLIFFIMAVSYSDSVAPNVPDNLNDRFYLLPTLHLIVGGLAQLLATYLVIRMWFEKSLPKWFMVKRIKPYMRATLTLWFITAALGAIIYVTWYGGSDSANNSENPAPISTEEPSPESTQEVDTSGTQVPESTEQPVSSDDDQEPVTTEEPTSPESTEEPEDS